MTPAELLADLVRRGVSVRVDGADLVLAPAARLAGVDLAAVKAAKPALLALLRPRVDGLENLAASSLFRLTMTLVVEVPGLGVPLLVAPSCAEAARLRESEPTPSAVLCVCRVLDLLLGGVDKAGARAVLEAALLLDGSVSSVRPA